MVLLSFDIEEFDVPREHGIDYPLKDAMKVSIYGTNQLLDCLHKHQVKATFFCTTVFAENAPELINRIIKEGHEVASHGCDHSNPQAADVSISKQKLEQQFGVTIKDYRQPRMFPVSDQVIADAGYLYNSSLNPAFIPGRYMHLNAPRTYFKKEDVWQIPASVTPWLRFPLFWLSCHNLPMSLYLQLCRRTWKHDGYLSLYFHPWEFYPLNNLTELKIPFIIRNRSGEKMIERLGKLISYFQNQGATFTTYANFVNARCKV